MWFFWKRMVDAYSLFKGCCDVANGVSVVGGIELDENEANALSLIFVSPDVLLL